MTISRLARGITAVVALAAMPRASKAQTPVTVHGVTFDSLHGVPLSGAFIAIVGTSRTTTSDARGQFVFDSVAPGTYKFVMQHDVFDSIGMSGASTRAAIATGRETVTIAVPSFAALWRAACPGPPPPADSGLVFGTVSAVGGQRTKAGAAVKVTWLESGYNKTTGITQHLWQLDVVSDSSGGYSLCGVPTTTGLRIRAATDSAATGFIDLLPLDKTRIQRRDLVLGALAVSSARGAIAGVVTGEAGKPLRDARVAADSGAEVRTDADGRFLLRNVPVGTQQIEVRAIGLTPVVATVTVTANDTARADVQLLKVTVLDTVRSTTSTVRQRLVTEYLDRKKAGWGQFRDSTQISRHVSLISVFEEMPSVTVLQIRNRSPQILLSAGIGKCLASLWIDRIKSDYDDLAALRPEDIAAIELYPRAMSMPADLLASMQTSASGITNMRCGGVVVWTKRIWP